MTTNPEPTNTTPTKPVENGNVINFPNKAEEEALIEQFRKLMCICLKNILKGMAEECRSAGISARKEASYQAKSDDPLVSPAPALQRVHSISKAQYRSFHLAYMFLRQTPYKAAENSVRPGNEPDLEEVERSLYIILSVLGVSVRDMEASPKEQLTEWLEAA